MSFWDKVDRYPPILCRLLARTRPYGPPASNRYLAMKTGMTEFEIVSLSQQNNWRGVDVPTMRRFTEACGVDFEDRAQMNRVSTYLSGKRINGHADALPPKFEYLRRSEDWEKFFKPLVLKLILTRNAEAHH